MGFTRASCFLASWLSGRGQRIRAQQPKRWKRWSPHAPRMGHVFTLTESSVRHPTKPRRRFICRYCLLSQAHTPSSVSNHPLSRHSSHGESEAVHQQLGLNGRSWCSTEADPRLCRRHLRSLPLWPRSIPRTGQETVISPSLSLLFFFLHFILDVLWFHWCLWVYFIYCLFFLQVHEFIIVFFFFHLFGFMGSSFNNLFFDLAVKNGYSGIHLFLWSIHFLGFFHVLFLWDNCLESWWVSDLWIVLCRTRVWTE